MPAHPPRRRLRRWLLIALAVGAVGVVLVGAALPSLVGTEFLRARILAKINEKLAPGRLDVDRFEVSWTGPTRLVGFKLIAPDGARVAEAPVAELNRSLGSLCFGSGTATILDLDRAILAIERHADGKLDLVEALQSVIKHPDPTRDLTVQIRGGSLTFRSDGLADPVVADTADLDLNIPPSPRSMTWNLKLGRSGGGELIAKGDTNRWTARDGNPSLADLRLDLEARGWPLQIRSAELATAGRLDGTVEIGRRSERWSVEANSQLFDLNLTGPRLAGDTFQPGPVAVVCDLTQSASGWSLRRLTVDSGVGSLRAECKLDPAFRFVTTAGQTQRVEGRVDLAALSKQLPQTLRLRPGLVVEGGSARLVAEASGPADRSTFHLEASIADLVAHDGDRRLSLQDPATITAEAVRIGDQVTIQKMTARTAFLNASATGQLDDATLTGSVDLGALRKQLGDWVDLGGLDGSGRAEFAGTYRVRDHRYTAELKTKGRDLRIVGVSASPIEQPLATLNLSVQGQPGDAGWPTGWESAELSTEAGKATGQVTLRPQGDAVAIQAKLTAELPGSESGQMAAATLDGSWSEARRFLLCDRFEARLTNAAGQPDERFKMLARGQYDGRAGSIDIDPIAEPGSNSGLVRLGPTGIRVSGLGRDLAAIRASAAIEGDQWSAGLTAQGIKAGVQFSAQAVLEPTATGDRKGSLAMTGRYSKADDRVELTDCRADSGFGGFTASGRLDDPTGARRFAIQGQLAPNYAAISDWLKRQVEPGANLAGQPRSFQLGGTLSGPDPFSSVEGEVGLDLKEADVYGMQLGPTPVILRARGGQVLVDPISTTLNEGHIRLEPEVLIRDSKGDPLLRLGKNSSIRDARINDEVSRRVLAFIAPILEGTTSASGRVSVDIDHAEIPLRSGRSRSAQVDGQVVFDDVAFAPGPLANDLLGAIGRRDASLKLDRPVTLTIADGRINQSGLALPLGDLTRIELAGWVGFDRSLALTATLPVTPAMLGNNPLLTDIAAGTQIRLPIGGTLDQPKIDSEAFTANLKDLGKSLLTRGATRGVLELLMRAGRPADPNAPPPPTAEDRKALRQERKAERKAQRGAPPGGNPNP